MTEVLLAGAADQGGTTRSARPRVVVVGAGAAGTLTAIHLLRAATRRATALEIVLVDPADRWRRGVAFGTPDETHLLNVPSAGMSARAGRTRRRRASTNAWTDAPPRWTPVGSTRWAACPS